MYCYRKHGHNETDEPAFTQPLMYEKIRQRPSVRRLYTDALIESGVLTPDELARQVDKLSAKRRAHFLELKDKPAITKDGVAITLLVLSPKLRWLFLVSPNVDAHWYYAIPLLRATAVLVTYYLLGHWFGDRALRWAESRSGAGLKPVLWIERKFHRARVPMTFLFPGNVSAMLAGSDRMPVPLFFGTALASIPASVPRYSSGFATRKPRCVSRRREWATRCSKRSRSTTSSSGFSTSSNASSTMSRARNATTSFGGTAGVVPQYWPNATMNSLTC